MGSSPPPKKEIQSVKFNDLQLNIKYSTLKFDNKEGKFLLIKNDDPLAKTKSTKDELSRLSDEEKILNDEILKKTKIVEDLKKKIEELNEKEELVKRILKIDINEKEYFNDLFEKYKKTKST